MFVRKIVHHEAIGGILLGFAAIAAIIMNNSLFSDVYDKFLTVPLAFIIGDFKIDKPLLLWVNDGLMAIFFLLVGLEIKREILQGRLSSRKKVSLPAIAAFGGILVPTLIYSYFNISNPETIHGWAIPAATDIAFTLGVITLLGDRVPDGLKVCLVAIAILDDLAAIIIIAMFYTENLSFYSLYLGATAILILAFLNKKEVTQMTPYVLTGIFLWACVLKSGVHATLAGVVLALFIPLTVSDSDVSPSRNVEKGLHPWVVYFVLPIFSFANAGVSFKGLSLDLLFHPITLGIALGLFFGKQIGITLFSFIFKLLKICDLPEGVNWRQYYGMSILAGIGFTMSLFIGTLAFDDIERQSLVRLGVLLGSAASGLLGFFLLFIFCPKNKQK